MWEPNGSSGAVAKTENHSSKKFKKVWKKDLTNLEKCGIMNKLFEWKTALHLEKWTMLKRQEKKKLETLSILNKIDFEKSDKTIKHSNLRAFKT